MVLAFLAVPLFERGCATAEAATEIDAAVSIIVNILKNNFIYKCKNLLLNAKADHICGYAERTPL